MRIFPSSRKARRGLALLVCLTAWLHGYCAARDSSILILRVSHGLGEIFHQAGTGDFGQGLLRGPVLPHVVSGSYLLFSPPRRAEAAAWDYIPMQYTFPDRSDRFAEPFPDPAAAPPELPPSTAP